MFNIYYFFTYCTVFFILVEFFYSIYKKDKIYSIKETVCNSLNGIAMRLMVYAIGTPSVFYLFIKKYRIFNLENFSQQNFFLSFVFCVILIDLSFYVIHRIYHSTKIFWMFHYVHHSGSELNLSTQLRSSWVEHLYLGSSLLILPFLFGFTPWVVVRASIFFFTYQFFTHSQYIKFPYFFTYLVITPELHAIHHDKKIKNQCSNLGSMFSIWDRLFGTYVDKIDTFNPGIKGYHQDNFIMAQVDPFISYFKNGKVN